VLDLSKQIFEIVGSQVNLFAYRSNRVELALEGCFSLSVVDESCEIVAM